MELSKASDFANVLKQEEKEVEELCNEILRVKPDVVITEKGVSDLAQHFLLKNNVSVIRRLRKTDNLRIGRVSGATICNRPEELEERDVGTECGLFEVKKSGMSILLNSWSAKTRKHAPFYLGVHPKTC